MAYFDDDDNLNDPQNLRGMLAQILRGNRPPMTPNPPPPVAASPAPTTPPLTRSSPSPAYDAYQKLETQAPQRTDFKPKPELSGWKKALGLGAGFALGSAPLVKYTLHGQEDIAKNKFGQAEKDYDVLLGRAKTAADEERQQAEEQRKQNPAPPNKEEQWTTVPGMTGPKGELIQEEKNSGQLRYAPLTGQPVKPETQNFEEKEFQEWLKTHPNGTRLQFEQQRSAATQKPEREPKQLAVGPDGTVIELKPGSKVPQGTKTVQKYGEPTADETRRADLARNMNENLDQLEEIVKRRPDLFGPVAGRTTKAWQFLGSGDADIAALQTLSEQTGMAMVGAHAMRNAQHVEAAANAITNSYKNKPDAVLSSIAKARKSLETFLKDEAKGPPTAKPQNNDPMGIR